ncbi:MAG TPA: hypothetical protein VM680_13240 [Verrucomicrobiae bacterium]|nr:hypothetical protein [Verrucomicrobiae bacterium]
MSASKAIVILANSVRSGHRCVAGKELIRNGDSWDVGPWIRITDPGTKDGSVRYELTRCRGGEEVQVLDVVEVLMQKPVGDEDHPEDWFVDTSQRWTHLRRLPIEELSRISDNPIDLWRDGGDGRSVPEGYVQKMGEPSTLFLIEDPLNARVSFWKERGTRGRDSDTIEKIRMRLCCTYGGVTHTFDITDPNFTERYHLFDRAESREQMMRLESPLHLCVSLTRPWNGRQYKIAATIFEHK